MPSHALVVLKRVMTFYLNLFKDAVAKFLFFSVKFIAFLTASSDVIFIGRSLDIKCLEVK